MINRCRQILATCGMLSSRRRVQKSRFVSHTAALVELLEVRQLLASDFGDAPDSSPSTGTQDYHTLGTNNGPSHVIDGTYMTLYMGTGVDADEGHFQNNGANRDDQFLTGGYDDEDGIINPMDLQATIGAKPVVTVQVTNRTQRSATLYGWIDFNQNGVFENETERATVAVPRDSDRILIPLEFPTFPAGSEGKTFARFRLSTDHAAASPTGPASDGEVEDYPFQINNHVSPKAGVTTLSYVAATYDDGSRPASEIGFADTIVAIGDVDGDGVIDLAATAPYDITNGSHSAGDEGTDGAVYILLMNSNGRVKESVRIGNQLNGGPQLTDGAHFGMSAAAIGDSNGDGIPDIAVSAFDSRSNTAQPSASGIWLIALNADGTAMSTKLIAAGSEFDASLVGWDAFAWTMTSPGDLDGNGTQDLVVGARLANESEGELHILLLNTNQTVRRRVTISNSEVFPTRQNYSFFGASVASLGDLDRDGTMELSVGTVDSASGIPKVTEVIVSVARDGSVKRVTSWSEPSEGSVPFLLDNDGGVLTPIGDINADGIMDAAFGTYSDGLIYVLHLNQNAEIQKIEYFDDPRVTAASDRSAYQTFGLSLAFLGDLNQDGNTDLAVGSAYGGSGNLSGDGQFQIVSVRNIAALRAPTAPVITGAASTTFGTPADLQWYPSEEQRQSAESFEVWIRNNSTGTHKFLNTSQASNVFKLDDSIPPGNYTIWVRAKNEAGMSVWSSGFRFRVLPARAVVHEQPDSMDMHPTVHWDAVEGASGYNIWINRAGDPTNSVYRTDVGGDLTSLRIPQKLPKGAYEIYVRAFVAGGVYGLWSAREQFRVELMTTIFPSSTLFEARPEIRWSALNGAESYQIWISEQSSPREAMILETVSSQTTSYIPNIDLATGHYRVWVRPLASGNRYGAWSNPIDLQVLLSPTIDAVIQPNEVGGLVIIRWTEIEGITRYRLRIEKSSASVPSTNTAYFDQFIDGSFATADPSDYPQGTYTGWLKAFDADGTESAWSAPVDIPFQSLIAGVYEDSKHSTPEAPAFYWIPTTPVDGFEVKIESLSNPSIAAKSIRTDMQSRLRLPEGLPLGRYGIIVRATSNDGTLGPWSRPLTYDSKPVARLTEVASTVHPAPLLTWSAVSGATHYELRVRGVPEDKFQMTRASLTATSFQMPSLPQGEYRWSIVAASGAFTSESPISSFAISGGPVTSVPAAFNAGSRSVTISWSELADANHYDFWLGSETRWVVLRFQNVNESQITISRLWTPGNYRVWVRAIDADDEAGIWSELKTFTVT